MGKEQDLKGQLNSSEAIFIEVLEGESSQEEMNNFLNTLSMNSEQRTARLGDLIKSLSQYKVDPSKASLQVKKGWAVMDHYISTKSQLLQENDLLPVVYGSMVYDDPYNLDFDLNFVGQCDMENPDVLEKEWVEELSKEWVGVGTQRRMIQGHSSYISFETLERHAKALSDNLVDYTDANDLDIFMDFLDASSILMGVSPYSDEQAVAECKERFIEIIRESPVLFSYTIWNLEQVLVDREVRRAGLDKRQTGEDNYKQPLSDRPGISPEIMATLQKRWDGETDNNA